MLNAKEPTNLNNLEVTIELARASDSESVWQWRNEPVSRSMSGNVEEIPWETHNLWFQTSLNSQSRKLYIGWLEQKRIGVCRFDFCHSDESAEVSINLNPEERGKGFSPLLLDGAIAKFRELFACKIIAKVKANNQASIRCFKKCGFSFTHESPEFYFYELN